MPAAQQQIKSNIHSSLWEWEEWLFDWLLRGGPPFAYWEWNLFLSSSLLVGYGRCQRQGLRQQRENEDKKQMEWTMKQSKGEFNGLFCLLLDGRRKAGCAGYGGGGCPSSRSKRRQNKLKLNEWTNKINESKQQSGISLIIKEMKWSWAAQLIVVCEWGAKLLRSAVSSSFFSFAGSASAAWAAKGRGELVLLSSLLFISLPLNQRSWWRNEFISFISFSGLWAGGPSCSDWIPLQES